MTHYIAPVGCFSVILVVLGYILLNIFFVTTSDEEINKLIFKKKETWIYSKLSPIYWEIRDESYNKLVLRLGRADSTDYRADIQVLGSLSKYLKNICNKNNSITVQIEEWGKKINKGVYESKLLQNQDCRKRLNFEINKFILETLESTRGGIKFSLEDTAFRMDSLKEKIQYEKSINDNTYILEYREELLKWRRERSRLRKVLSVANSMIPKYK
jgi:hypothetical protein